MLKWLTRSKEPAPVPELGARARADELMRRAFPLHRAGDVTTAEVIYREILALVPDYADAHYLLGRMAHEQGRNEDAIRHIRKALQSNNKEPAFHQTLGESYFALGLWNEAIAYLSTAVELDPSNHESWNNLGCAYEQSGNRGETIRCFERALAIAPDRIQTLNNCANALQDRGRIEEAVALFRRARAQDPNDAELFSNYLYALNFSARFSPADVFREHLEYGRLFGGGAPALRREVNRDPARKLRIGYFSPDLRAHPVWCFIEPILQHHDRNRFEVHCYYLYPWHDHVSTRLKSIADHWIDCAAWTDQQIGEHMNGAGIDILVDLAGHTGRNRLTVLGQRPAPVSVTWLGYPNTTGLGTVDYRLTDDYSDPPGVAEALNTETLVRFPHGHWCFLRPEPQVPVAELPALARGQICFGSFNNTAKLTDDILQLWAEVLRGVPGSTLLIWGVGDEQRERVRRTLGSCGVSQDRIEAHGRTGFPEQLAMHQRVDIALDTHPYSGVTTSFNALWMGVPILTLHGTSSASRSTGSILSTLGLSDWIAGSREEFVTLAARKAADPAVLATLRAQLRETLERSILMDGSGFTRELEDIYLNLWRSYCGNDKDI